MARITLLGWMVCLTVWAQAPKRLLYVTHSAGFVHGSIGISRTVMAEAGQRTGVEVVSTEDLSYLDAGRLDAFDAVFFFTSGELPLSDTRKRNLLAFVRGAKGSAAFTALPTPSTNGPSMAS